MIVLCFELLNWKYVLYNIEQLSEQFMFSWTDATRVGMQPLALTLLYLYGILKFSLHNTSRSLLSASTVLKNLLQNGTLVPS